MTSRETAPDGSPVEVFRRLPPEPAVDHVTAGLAPGVDVLDLGCGAGRLAHALAARGHRVVAVDQSPEMLACVEGCETVRADAAALDLGRRFGGVVLASYLVNHPRNGLAFLQTCRRHVTDDGAVVIQRYDPVWARSEGRGSAVVAGVVVSVVTMEVAGERLSATVEYEVDGRRWRQPVEARLLDDGEVEGLAAGAGLALDRWLDDLQTWARLVPLA